MASNVYGVTGDFQMTMGGEFDFLSTDRQLFNSYHSTGAANNRHVNDPTFDGMVEAARTIFDRDEQNAAYQDIQRYLYDEAINVPLSNGGFVSGTNKFPSAERLSAGEGSLKADGVLEHHRQRVRQESQAAGVAPDVAASSSCRGTSRAGAPPGPA